MVLLAALPAVLAALLFGASTPAAKLLVGRIDSLLFAGLLYLGSGLALGLVLAARSPRRPYVSRRDLPWLAGSIATGGIVAPVALLWGLTRVSATSASLLLSLEAIFTALIAAIIFHEHVGARIGGALVLVTLGAVVSAGGGGGAADVFGLLAVGLACFCWAVDNNFTREIEGMEPRTIAMTKGLAAGIVNAGLAVGRGTEWPDGSALGWALFVGALGYGASLVLFVESLRRLGAARTAAWFAAAPFVGAVIGVSVLGEPFGARIAGAAALIGAATWLMLGEAHRHIHHHDPMEHTHVHRHDDHHRHEHEGWEGEEPHLHRHRHAEMTHEHPHAPDVHHRHNHEEP